MAKPLKEIEARGAELAELCGVRRWTVGFAESCTAGLLSSWVGSRPGASKYFKGAVVSYSGDVKSGVLGVPSHMLAVHGEVSIPVAREMARGARVALGVDWSVSLTGIAGPTGGSVDKPVGTVYFAVCGPGFERVSRQQFAPKLERQDIQRQAALFAFDFLLSAMRWPKG